MTKFKIGDRVRVIADPEHGFPTAFRNERSRLEAGVVGTVVSGRDYDSDYSVEDSESGKVHFVGENSLEALTETPKLGARVERITTHVEVEKVVTEIEERVEEVVTLTMTPAQAETLRAIFRRIGGTPDLTRRGFADEIDLMLMEAGVKSPDGVKFQDTGMRSAIYFDVEEGLR